MGLTPSPSRYCFPICKFLFNRLVICSTEAMVMTNFNGTGVGFGVGIGCGFGVGWGFGGMPLNFLGLGVGGGCGIGVGLGWGFGSAFGSQYRNSRVTFDGMDFINKEHSEERDSKDLAKGTRKAHASQ